MRNNNSLTCLNDDTEPTQAFPRGQVPMGEKMTVPGSSYTSNTTNSFTELMLSSSWKTSSRCLSGADGEEAADGPRKATRAGGKG